MTEDKITVFKIKNRSGYAAICKEHLTEGKSKLEAMDRMIKALKRTTKKKHLKKLDRVIAFFFHAIYTKNRYIHNFISFKPFAFLPSIGGSL